MHPPRFLRIRCTGRAELAAKFQEQPQPVLVEILTDLEQLYAVFDGLGTAGAVHHCSGCCSCWFCWLVKKLQISNRSWLMDCRISAN